MIVLGADTHKRSHTIAAVAAATGELLGEQTVAVDRRGFGALLQWARSLDGDRVWALEDCRHVSGSLERFLIERGERVLRIPTHLTAKARKSARRRGKSDAIDALNVARAALQEGLESFPAAQLDGPELDLRLLGRPPRAPRPPSRRAQQHAAVASARSVARAAAAGRRAVLEEVEHADRPAARPRRADDARPDRARRAAPPARAHARDQPARARDHRARGAARAAAARRAGVRAADRRQARRRDRRRAALRDAAKLARAAGVAPIPASSGNTQRHRLDQGGNRQINAALHRVIVTRARCHQPTRDYIERRRSEGKSTREAIRCLKRYLARRVWRLLQPPNPVQDIPTHQSLDIEATRGAAPRSPSSSTLCDGPSRARPRGEPAAPRRPSQERADSRAGARRRLLC